MAETLRELVVALSLEKAISRAICAPQKSRSRKPSSPSIKVSFILCKKVIERYGMNFSTWQS